MLWRPREEERPIREEEHPIREEERPIREEERSMVAQHDHNYVVDCMNQQQRYFKKNLQHSRKIYFGFVTDNSLVG